MNRRNQDDLRLLKKAKHRVHAMLIVSYLALCLWPAGVYVLLNQPFFTRPDSFTLTYLISMLVEMVVWMGIFFVVSDGKPAMRHLITAGIVAEFAFVVWLVYDMIRLQNLAYLPVYLIWAVLELVKDFYLCWMLGWMKTSWWAKIYFDHTIELSESERIEEARRRQQAAKARAAARAKAEQEARARAEMEARRQKTSYATQAYRESHQSAANSYYVAPDIQQGQTAASSQMTSSSSAANQPPMAEALQARAARQQAMQNAANQPAYADTSNGYPVSQPGLPASQAPAASGSPEAETAYESSSYPYPAGSNAASWTSDYQTDEELAAKTKQERERANRKRLSSAYPRTAIRLALFVYGELILFPVGVHVFQNSFVSIDNSSVFAVNLMFTLCILTAVVWTLPIFFLYLKQPGVKKMLIAAVVLQLAVIAFGGWSLYRYYNVDPSGTVYSMKVFTLFGMLEVLRYGLLLVGVIPAFKLPEIRDRHTSKMLSIPQDEEEESYEFELIDEENPEDMDASLDDLFEDEEIEDDSGTYTQYDNGTSSRSIDPSLYSNSSSAGYDQYDENYDHTDYDDDGDYDEDYDDQKSGFHRFLDHFHL